MENNFFSSCKLPTNTPTEQIERLRAFVGANFRPAFTIESVSIDADALQRVTVRLQPDQAANDAHLQRLVDLFLSGNLVSIYEAAARCGTDRRIVSNAVRVGQIAGYIDPDRPNPNYGKLVDLRECRQTWPP